LSAECSKIEEVMGFYLRKSFRAGPVRLNLSKSGLGVSAGVKGLRIGSGPRGNYIHAGRGGLYYRENLGGKTRYSSSSDSSGLLGVIGVIIALVILVNLAQWLVENPAALIAIISTVIIVLGFIFYKKYSKQKAINNYKRVLDEIFILESSKFDSQLLASLKKKLETINCDNDISKIEKNIYGAVLDKILDDRKITEAEKNSILNLESIVSVDEQYKKETKIEIFNSYYVEAVEDRIITESELETLQNITEGLGIDNSDIEKEMQTVREIIKMQQLTYPLHKIDNVPVTIQKSENAFYSANGKVLSRKKAARNSCADYEYSVKRDGILVVTDKRVIVVKEGTTAVKLADILDVEVDIDNKFILLSKGTSSTPTIIQTEEALLCGKIIDLFRENMA
jgi:Protein of unknown function (DUF4236)